MKADTARPLRNRITPVLLLAWASGVGTSYAQLSINNTAGVFLIDFSTTVLGVNNGPWAGTGFEPGATTLGRLDSNAWAVTGWSNGALAFGGTQTTATTDYTRGASSAAVTTGGMYAFSGGNITSGVALGFQPGGSDWAPGTLTLKVKNDTTSHITGFSLDYKLWVRNDQGRANSFNFLRSADDSVYTQDASADYTSTAVSDALGFTLVTRTLTISNLGLTAGGFYYLRWAGGDASGSGSRDEFALDDIRLSSFTTGIAGRNLLWSPITGAWDTTSLHWTEAAVSTAFQANDNVTFDDTGLAAGATVSISVAGVTVGNTKVTNTTGTYTFIGGAIGGSGAITKTGVGKLVLSSANAHTGGTNVNEGTVSISDDAQLGGVGATLALAATGTLETTGSLTLNAGRTVTGSGTLNIAASTTLNIAGSANLGAITLSNTGSLTFSGTASPALTGLTLDKAVLISSTLPILLNGPITTTYDTGTATINAPISFATSSNVTVADGAAAVDLLLAGALAMPGSARLTKLGDGALELTGTSNFAGLRIGTAGTLPASGGTVIIHDADDLGVGQLQFNAGTLQNAGSPITTTIGISLGAGQFPNGAVFNGSAITFQGTSALFKATGSTYQHKITANADVTLAGGLNVSSGTGTSDGLTITGLATVFLPAAANTLIENITVDTGKLEISGALTGATLPSITVKNSGTLSGSTSGVSGLGALTIEANGNLSPGIAADHTGTLILSGSVNIKTGGIFFVDIAGIGTGAFDQLNVTGTVTLGGTLSTTLLGGYTPAPTDILTIILNDGADPVSGTFTGLAEGAAIGATGFFISYAAGDGGNDVVLSTVPEPASVALLLGGLGLLGFRRRRN